MMKMISIFFNLVFFVNTIYAFVSITPYGAAETISGSCFLLESENSSVIVDCGLFMSEDLKNTDNRNRQLDGKLIQAKTLCLTHAHLDHSGKIPLLIHSGFNGKIYSTNATKKIVLELFKDRNGFNLIKRNWFWVQSRHRKIRYRKKFTTVHWRLECKNNIKSLRYSRGITYLDDLEKQESTKFILCKKCCHLETKELEKYFVAVNYDLETKLSKNLTVKFINAGHIPGSSSLMFTLDNKNILFSGDLGSGHSRFNGMFSIPESADLVFMEATYGSSIKKSNDQYNAFRKDLVKAVSKNKTIWIPALALNRTQKILYELKLMQEEGLLSKDIPVYSVSPSANAITDLYQKELSSNQLKKIWFLEDVYQNASILPEGVKFQMVRKYDEQMIILSSSGDMDRGKSYQLMSKMLPNKNVFVMLVNYISPLSNAGCILKGKKLDNGIRSAASIKQYDIFSDHADFAMMQKWLSNQNKDAKIYIIHSSKCQSQEAVETLQKIGWKNVSSVIIGKSVC